MDKFSLLCHQVQLVPWHGKVARPFWKAIRRLRTVASFVCKLFYHNTSYLVQYHNAGARKDSVPGHCYFLTIERFTNEHYEEGENYREFLKLSCQENVREICSFCCEWTGPPIERCPKPVPDHSCLSEYHYLSTRKPQEKSVIQMTGSQGSKQEKSMEVAGGGGGLSHPKKLLLQGRGGWGMWKKLASWGRSCNF